MISEMIDKMPTAKDDLLTITNYSKLMYDTYSGEEFLSIFQQYSKLINSADKLLNETLYTSLNSSNKSKSNKTSPKLINKRFKQLMQILVTHVRDFMAK